MLLSSLEYQLNSLLIGQRRKEMNKDKQEYLYKEYPKIFSELFLLKRDGGLTVGDGWFAILDALCERISNTK